MEAFAVDRGKHSTYTQYIFCSMFGFTLKLKVHLKIYKIEKSFKEYKQYTDTGKNL